jgi:hypothetical protein
VLHDQLFALGFDVARDDLVTETTMLAVREFQRARGLEETSFIWATDSSTYRDHFFEEMTS